MQTSENTADTTTRSYVRVAGVSGLPTGNASFSDDLVAAVTIAVLEAWPEPTAAAEPSPPNVSWRFGQRRWRDRQIPRQSWGR